MREFPSDPKLHDYEAFIAIVDTGNLTRAAARLRRSLQSVSRSLSGLEAQLGGVLIRRTTRTAQPTEAGLAFHRRVSAAFREIALAEAEVGDTSETLSGTLRVAGSAFFVGHYVVPTIRDFSLQHPRVKFDLRISEEFAEPIRSGVRPHDSGRPASALADEVAQDRIASTRRDRFALVCRTTRSTRDSGRPRAARLHHSNIGARRSRVDVPRSGRDSPSGPGPGCVRSGQRLRD